MVRAARSLESIWLEGAVAKIFYRYGGTVSRVGMVGGYGL